MKKVNLMVMLIFLAFSSFAAFLENVPTKLIQPNGKVINCFITGDEFYRCVHDSMGYTIVKNPQTQYFVYALPMEDTITHSNYVVGVADPIALGLKKWVTISSEKIRARREAFEKEYAKHKLQKSANDAATKGVLNNIVIFISFADDTTFSKSFTEVYNDYMDSSSSSAVSVYNYYRTVSYGQFYLKSSFYPIQNDTIIVSYKDVNPRAYYSPYDSITNPNGYTSSNKTSREHLLLYRAVEAVKSQIPSSIEIDSDGDGRVDNVSFILNGSSDAWNDLLWPHRWSLYTTAAKCYINGKRVYDYNFLIEDDNSVGVITHELFHSLGAPDLYHYYHETTLNPVGVWDLMASTNRGKPQGLGAYMKYKYGNWIDAPITITQPGTYTLYPANGDRKDRLAYRIPIINSDEYLFIEYRRASSNSFDSPLPGSGIIIYRINPKFEGNANYEAEKQKWDEVYVFRPNGTTTSNGNVSRAYMSAGSGRTSFSADMQTNPSPYFCNGDTIFDIAITDITEAGDSIQFTYTTSVVTLTTDKTLLTLDAPANSSETIEVSSNGDWFIENLDTNMLEVSPSSGGSAGTTIVSIKAKHDNYLTFERSTSFNITTASISTTINVKQKMMDNNVCRANTNIADNDTIKKQSVPNNLIAVGEYFGFTNEVVADSMMIYFGNINNIGDDDNVKFTIYNSNSSKRPGTTITSFTIPITSLKENAWNTIHFDLPIVFTKAFIISYEMRTTKGGTLDLLVADHVQKAENCGSLLQKLSNVWRRIDESDINGSNSATLPIKLFVCPASDDADYLNVSTENNVIGPKETDIATLNISSNASWSIYKKPIWAETTPMSGQYNGTITVSPNYNDSKDSLVGTIYVRSGSIVKSVTIKRVENTVTIAEHDIESILVYPNPANNILNVELLTEDYIYQIDIFNVLGQKMNLIDYQKDNNISIDISNLSKGLYILQIKTSNTVITRNFIKQ